MSKLIYGFGINDLTEKVYKTEVYIIDGIEKRRNAWVCPYYKTWKNMLKRSYSSKYKSVNPAYEGVSVCGDWKILSKFKVWMETQDWKGKQLDKDLLVEGNKIYSPETCCFVSARVNTFLLSCGASRGEYLLGVDWDKTREKYRSRCWSVETGRQKFLGYFNNQEDAHHAWKNFKAIQATLLANEQTDPRIVKALLERYLE